MGETLAFNLRKLASPGSIAAEKASIYALAAESKGVNLTGFTNPITVVLTIGNNRGSTAATAQFH